MDNGSHLANLTSFGFMIECQKIGTDDVESIFSTQSFPGFMFFLKLPQVFRLSIFDCRTDIFFRHHGR
jgi:hypothetical protein